jgi:hypothetical protein
VTQAELEAVWHAVERPVAGGTLAGRPAPGTEPTNGVLLALDEEGRRHVLIPAALDDDLPARPTTKGLEVTVDQLSVGGQPSARYYDVACRDASMNSNFTAVATEILDALGSVTSVRATLEAVLARWRWFWEIPPVGLGDTEAVGLFGELWFLEFWLDPIDPRTLTAWTGPEADRHDFKWPDASVEVKATRARTDGAATHRISSLDQLEDPAQGDLYLFSLRVSPDPIAMHSLNGSVERIRKSLSERSEVLHLFDERLGTLGYSPAHRDLYDTPFRVVAEELYRVDDGFPRLTAGMFDDGVPAGVDSIAYTVDLAACKPWRVATAPGIESRRLRESLNG